MEGGALNHLVALVWRGVQKCVPLVICHKSYSVFSTSRTARTKKRTIKNCTFCSLFKSRHALGPLKRRGSAVSHEKRMKAGAYDVLGSMK